MTITDIADPTRNVELGTEVDEQQQDTEVKEKSFFESYADWFVGLVDGESNGDEADDAAMQQQQQPSSGNTHTHEDQGSNDPAIGMMILKIMKKRYHHDHLLRIGSSRLMNQSPLIGIDAL